jgi:hypothetical protein
MAARGGKRGPAARTSGSSLKKMKTGEDGLQDILETAEFKSAAASMTWVSEVMEKAELLLHEYGGPVEALNCAFKTQADKVEWAKQLEVFLPNIPGEKYIEAWSEGTKSFKVWQASWHKQAGNSGFVDNEKIIKLINIILVRGLRTDPKLYPGTEYPTLAKPELKFSSDAGFCGIPMDSASSFDDGSLGVGGVHFGKGWKRLLAAQIALYVSFLTNHMDDLLANVDVKRSFQVVKCYFYNKSAAELIDLNRGMCR